MTDRQQSAFFLAIIFLFTAGAGLLIYKQYSDYYDQKAAIDLEAASTPSIVPVKSILSSDSQQATAWKTYKDNKFGFELEYPSDWRVDPNRLEFANRLVETGELTEEKIQSLGRLEVQIEDNTKNLNITEWCKEHDAMIGSNNLIQKEQSTTIANLPACYDRSVDVGESIGYMVAYESKIFTLNIYLGDHQGNTSPFFSKYDYMIKSFKFTK